MTIYQQYGNKPFDPATTPRTPDGVYDLKDTAQYGFEWCFDDFWSEDERREPGFYRMAANTRIDGRWIATPEHVASLVKYAQWITDVFHMPCYIVRNPCDLDELYRDDREHAGEHGGRLKDPTYKHQVRHDEKHMYGIEVRYDTTHKADQFFTAVCYARFACYEYTQFARELNGFTPRTLLRDIFAGEFILKLLHMPFIDFMSLFDGFGQNPNKPQINAEFGEALHDFALTLLKTRKWRTDEATRSGATHNSYINSSEFHAFYAAWKRGENVLNDQYVPAPAPAPVKVEAPVREKRAGFTAYPEQAIRMHYRLPRNLKLRWDDDKE